MSWERKLLHCGPRADRRDLLAHYLFISVLHRWLPKGSDRGVSLHRLLVGTGVLDTAARWTDACYWKDNLAAYRSLLLSGDSMRPVNIFFFMCNSYLWTCLSLTMLLQTVPQMLLLLYLSIFPSMVVQADHLNGLKRYSRFFFLLVFVRSKLSLTLDGCVLRYLWNVLPDATHRRIYLPFAFTIHKSAGWFEGRCGIEKISRLCSA